MKRIRAFRTSALALLIAWSDTLHWCLGHHKRQEAIAPPEHIELQVAPPPVIITVPGLEVAPPPAPFVPDDDGAVYEPLFRQRARVAAPWLMPSLAMPWLAESVVDHIKVLEPAAQNPTP